MNIYRHPKDGIIRARDSLRNGVIRARGFVASGWNWLTLERVAGLVTIAGIIFGVWQYLVTKQDLRISATLSYATRFESTPVWESFLKIYNTWNSTEGNAIESSKDPDKVNEQAIAFIKAHKLDMDAIIVGDFFDQLYLCLQENICDLQLAVQMLGKDAQIAYVYAGPYLDDLRAKRRGHTGCGLTALYNIAEDRLEYDRETDRSSPPPVLTFDPNACPRI
jgi:hypothetical protein